MKHFDATDLESLFPQAHALGFEKVEVYRECTQAIVAEFLGRTDVLAFSERQGTSLRAIKDGTWHWFSVDCGDAQSLLSTLQGQARSTLTSHGVSATAPSELGAQASSILATARTAFSSQAEKLQTPYLKATLTRRHYQVCRMDEALQEGWEEAGDVQSHWVIDGKRYSWERARGSLAGLVDETASPQGLVASVKLSLNPRTAWPAPQGRVPVLWSARSVAKLQMLLLSAFEGDRVLSNRSFLNELPLPLDFQFNVQDKPERAGTQVDHEGSVRRATYLLRDGKPTALACNRKLAQALEVQPTGHARRASFEAAPVVGFWHPHLEPRTSAPAILQAMESGISVREIEVLHFDPASGAVEIRLVQSFLVHHGAEGEPMESVVLRMGLVDLLKSFNVFEDQSLTTGIAVGKQNQKLYTEVTAPAVLSSPLPVPGTVPPNHYW